MFTGIVQGMGEVVRTQSLGGDLSLTIDSGTLAGQVVALGDSIALNGVCLTVVEAIGLRWRFDVSVETLARTLLGRLRIGERVNLEFALLPTTRLGGHFVSGHVDGVGRLLELSPSARSYRLRFVAPADLARFIAEKGSIAVDGVSLTVNDVRGEEFEVNIVPHTWQHTIMQYYQPDREVHLEVDLLARYLDRLMSAGAQDGQSAGSAAPAEQEGITRQFLAQQGFLAPEE